MIKRLSRHGNSMALILDRSILDLLKIAPDTPLDVSTDGEKLIVSPVRDEKRVAQFREALDHVNTRYGRALKRLAE
jgi:antitoxin MazE